MIGGNQLMVRTERLELSRLAALEPNSSVSTNSTTSAENTKTKTPDQRSGASGIWGGRRGSNPRHQEPQSCALPTELRPPYQLLVPELPNGAPGRTRTCDHPLRRRMLYPAELRALINPHHRCRSKPWLQQNPTVRSAFAPSCCCARQAGESYRGDSAQVNGK